MTRPLLVILLCGVSASAFSADLINRTVITTQEPDPSTLRITGQASATVDPQDALILFRIEGRGRAASVAAQKAEAAARALREALTAAGYSDGEVIVLGARWSEEEKGVVTETRRVRLRTSRMPGLSEALRRAATVPDVSIEGARYAAPAQPVYDLVRLAVEDARRKAETLAGAAGFRLVGLRLLTDPRITGRPVEDWSELGDRDYLRVPKLRSSAGVTVVWNTDAPQLAATGGSPETLPKGEEAPTRP